MKEKTKKLVTIIMLALALVGTVLAILFAMNQQNNGLYWAAYVLTLCLALAAIILIAVFYITNLAKQPKKLVKTLIGLVVVIAVVVVLYLIAPSNDISLDTMSKYDVTAGVSKFVGASLYLVYALVAAAAIAIVYVECSKAFKKK